MAGSIKVSTMVVTIIPTIGRKSLKRAVESAIDGFLDFMIPLTIMGGTAGENRNKGIQIAKILSPDWISFLDDDDYYKYEWALRLDDDYDIVVFRMKQGEAIIPDATDELRFENVGINFALNMNRIKWEDLPEFDSDGEGEDWRFLEKLLQKYNKVKITKDIYYVAEKRSYNQ
jgi:glycosyltransferase involved in cell wall biosynthesis